MRIGNWELSIDQIRSQFNLAVVDTKLRHRIDRCRHTYVQTDMFGHMRTTVRLNEALLRQAKNEAARRGETLTALIERGLRLALAGPVSGQRRARVRLPVSRATGGTHSGVNLDDSAAMLDLLEGRR